MILLSCRVLRCDPNAKFQPLMFRRRRARWDVLFDFVFEELGKFEVSQTDVSGLPSALEGGVVVPFWFPYIV